MSAEIKGEHLTHHYLTNAQLDDYPDEKQVVGNGDLVTVEEVKVAEDAWVMTVDYWCKPIINMVSKHPGGGWIHGRAIQEAQAQGRLGPFASDVVVLRYPADGQNWVRFCFAHNLLWDDTDKKLW